MPARNSRSAECSPSSTEKFLHPACGRDGPRKSGGKWEPTVRGTRQYALICSVHAKGLPYKSPFPKETHQKGLLQKGKRKSDLHENARAICTRNSKQVMKIGPREKRFCFSRGPIFCMIFCKDILQQPLVFISRQFLRTDGFRFTRFFPRPPRFWRQTSSSLSKRPERTAWGRPLHPRCTVPVPARVGA